MPLRASFPFNNCQEAVKYSVKQCISAMLFLWFASTGASCLDSVHCTHCSGIHCSQRVPRVPIINQSRQESRLSARVTRKHGNKDGKKSVFQATLARCKAASSQYLRDS